MLAGKHPASPFLKSTWKRRMYGGGNYCKLKRFFEQKISQSSKSKTFGPKFCKFLEVILSPIRISCMKWETKSNTWEELWRSKNGWRIKKLARHQTVWEKMHRSIFYWIFCKFSEIKEIKYYRLLSKENWALEDQRYFDFIVHILHHKFYLSLAKYVLVKIFNCYC